MLKKERKRIRKPVVVKKGGSRTVSKEDQAKAAAKITKGK